MTWKNIYLTEGPVERLAVPKTVIGFGDFKTCCAIDMRN
jgi:hypothetical protein